LYNSATSQTFQSACGYSRTLRWWTWSVRQSITKW